MTDTYIWPPSEVKGKGGTLSSSPYNWVDKSPVVDELRTLMGNEPYRKVAERVGVSAVTIHFLFSGKTRNPSTSTIEKFANAYGLRIGLVRRI